MMTTTSGSPESVGSPWFIIILFLVIAALWFGVMGFALLVKAVRLIVRGPSLHRRVAELQEFAESLPSSTTFHKGITSRGLTATVYDQYTGREEDRPIPAHLDAPEVAYDGNRSKVEPVTQEQYLARLKVRLDNAESGRPFGIVILLFIVPLFLLLAAGFAFLAFKL